MCKTPELVSGKDLRSLNSEVICPELRQSSLSPAESDSGLITTYPEVGPHPPKGAIPLSVLILSLLVLFVSAFFAAAALCAYALKSAKSYPLGSKGKWAWQAFRWNVEYSQSSHPPYQRLLLPITCTIASVLPPRTCAATPFTKADRRS